MRAAFSVAAVLLVSAVPSLVACQRSFVPVFVNGLTQVSQKIDFFKIDLVSLFSLHVAAVFRCVLFSASPSTASVS